MNAGTWLKEMRHRNCWQGWNQLVTDCGASMKWLQLMIERVRIPMEWPFQMLEWQNLDGRGQPTFGVTFWDSGMTKNSWKLLTVSVNPASCKVILFRVLSHSSMIKKKMIPLRVSSIWEIPSMESSNHSNTWKPHSIMSLILEYAQLVPPLDNHSCMISRSIPRPQF